MNIKKLMILVDEYAERRHGRGFVSDDSMTYPRLVKMEREAREAVERAIGEIVAEERDGCAKVCEVMADSYEGKGWDFSNDFATAADRCRDAILERSNG